MSTLDRALRKQLADTIGAARQIAEEAVADTVRRLGVIEDEAPKYLTPDDKTLRVRLRAHAQTLGDGWSAEEKRLLTSKHLEDEAAYEVWHRMLFGRFLVERGLLIHPELREPIDPKELPDLARDEGLSDPWALVERFAAPSLPAVFKPDDPVLKMTLDPALAKRLRDLVAALPCEVFAADDSLGWTYQFWRTAEKDAVNRAGGKIGAAELPAVTQLFTEPYIVKFLLHNTLGAWWAGKILSANPDLARDAADEQSLRDACALAGVAWDHLRFVREGSDGPWCPAAGTFPGWPSSAAEITYCDPCCGSGHFLVEAFAILAALRQREEGLSGADVARAVLRDNLHGLEIDGRCVQIATFNVALAAWRVAGGPVALPQPHIAWVGAPPPLSRSEMGALANGDAALGGALVSLHDQFAQAPLLGSLLQVGARDLLDTDLRERGEAALAKLRGSAPERAEGAIAARGLLDATALLGRRYVLLATNVPFLGYRDMCPALADWVRTNRTRTKGDLGYCIWDKFLEVCNEGSTVAVVTLQHWMSAVSYSDFRRNLLGSKMIHLIAYLGTGAFDTITGGKVNIALSISSNTRPGPDHEIGIIDVGAQHGSGEKSASLRVVALLPINQTINLLSPAHTVALAVRTIGPVLGEYSRCFTGLMNGDTPRFTLNFSEVARIKPIWTYMQSTTEGGAFSGGFSKIVYYDEEYGHLREDPTIRRGRLHNSDERGNLAWGKLGVAINQMADLSANYYYGYKYDANVAVVLPKEESNLLPMFSFIASAEFTSEIRAVDRKMNVMGGTINRVPFDVKRWSAIAAERYPDGLPEPYSDDPTQWLFHGHPAFTQAGTELLVALARIAGYRWPAETDTTMRLADLAKRRIALATALPGTDADGLLPLHETAIERSLADRLRTVLAVAYGAPLTPSKEADLIRAADAKLDKKEARDVTLEAWLRDRAFRQHCVLFQHRPFLWHVWDGVKDGFSAFLYYHRLGYAALEKLTFTVLGDWIAKARAEGRTAHESRAQQLQQRLRLILDGDKPHDIFVRWKPLARQPIGWHPDFDDGVRLNVRPFMTAEVLREQPKINWNKDRGADVASAPWYHLGPTYGGKQGDRINDHHLSLAEKRAAQPQAKAS